MSDAFSSCFALRMEIEEDGAHYTTLCLPSSAIRMSPDQLSTLIRALGRARTDMLPPIESVDPHLPDELECTTVLDWQVTQDSFLEKAQMCFLHPGYGWLKFTMTDAQLEAFMEQLNQAKMLNKAGFAHPPLMN